MAASCASHLIGEAEEQPSAVERDIFSVDIHFDSTSCSYNHMQSAAEIEQGALLQSGLNQPTSLKNNPACEALNLPNNEIRVPASLHVLDTPIACVLEQQAQQESHSPELQRQSIVEHALRNSEDAFQTAVTDSKVEDQSEFDSLQRSSLWNDAKSNTMQLRFRSPESDDQQQQQVEQHFYSAPQSRSPSRSPSQGEEDPDLQMYADNRDRYQPYSFYDNGKGFSSSHHDAYNEQNYWKFTERFPGVSHRPPRMHHNFRLRTRMPYEPYSRPDRFRMNRFIPRPLPRPPITMQHNSAFGHADFNAPVIHHRFGGTPFAARQPNMGSSQFMPMPDNSFPRAAIPDFASTSGPVVRPPQHRMLTNFGGGNLQHPDTAAHGGHVDPRFGRFGAGSFRQRIPLPPPPPHVVKPFPMHLAGGGSNPRLTPHVLSNHLQTNEQHSAQGSSAASQQLLTSQQSGATTNGLQLRPIAEQEKLELGMVATSGTQLSGIQRFIAPPPPPPPLPPPPPPPPTSRTNLQSQQRPSESTMNQFLANLAMQAGLINETLATYIQRQKVDAERSKSKDDTRSLDMELEDAPNSEADAIQDNPSDKASTSAKLDGEREQQHAREGERKRDHKSVLKRDLHSLSSTTSRWLKQRSIPEAIQSCSDPHKEKNNVPKEKLDTVRFSEVLPKTDKNEELAAPNEEMQHLDSLCEHHTPPRKEKHAKVRDAETHRKHPRRSKSDHSHHRHHNHESKAKKRLEVQPDSTERVHRLGFRELLSNEVRENLKSYYNKKKITKDEFKVLMDKCVEKIFAACNSGRVNEKKVKKFVDSYVVKVMKTRKQTTKRQPYDTQDEIELELERGMARSMLRASTMSGLQMETAVRTPDSWHDS